MAADEHLHGDQFPATMRAGDIRDPSKVWPSDAFLAHTPEQMWQMKRAQAEKGAINNAWRPALEGHETLAENIAREGLKEPVEMLPAGADWESDGLMIHGGDRPMLIGGHHRVSVLDDDHEVPVRWLQGS